MDALCQDARLAFRSLRKAPAFSGAAIATIALGIGATTAIFSAMNAAHVVSESLSRQRLGMLLMFILGLAAIALAGIGVYGVIAYSVAQRVREVAIRMALGATPAEVFRLTVVRAQVIAVAGVLGGLVLAYCRPAEFSQACSTKSGPGIPLFWPPLRRSSLWSLCWQQCFQRVVPLEWIQSVTLRAE